MLLDMVESTFDEDRGRDITATDDYVDIYQEYVTGPLKGRKGGTYGIVQADISIRGVGM